MIRLLLSLLCLLNLFISSFAYSAPKDSARELHHALNAADREVLPKQLVHQLLLVRPEARGKEGQLQRIILEILDSKEYEQIRVEYFSKAFTDQQLLDQLVLARTPAFALYQRKIAEMAQFSGGALMQLFRTRLAQLDNPQRKPEPDGVSHLRTTFYSEDYGDFFISSWLFLDQKTERIYRGQFSDQSYTNKHSSFTFCVARQLATTSGLGAWVTTVDPDDDRSILIGLLKKGENSITVLGPTFANGLPVEVDNKIMSELCVRSREQATVRRSAPNSSVNTDAAR